MVPGMTRTEDRGQRPSLLSQVPVSRLMLGRPHGLPGEEQGHPSLCPPITCSSENLAMKLRFLLMSTWVGECSSSSLSFCSWPGRHTGTGGREQNPVREPPRAATAAFQRTHQTRSTVPHPPGHLSSRKLSLNRLPVALPPSPTRQLSPLQPWEGVGEGGGRSAVGPGARRLPRPQERSLLP